MYVEAFSAGYIAEPAVSVDRRTGINDGAWGFTLVLCVASVQLWQLAVLMGVGQASLGV